MAVADIETIVAAGTLYNFISLVITAVRKRKQQADDLSTTHVLLLHSASCTKKCLKKASMK